MKEKIANILLQLFSIAAALLLTSFAAWLLLVLWFAIFPAPVSVQIATVERVGDLLGVGVLVGLIANWLGVGRA